MGFLGRGGRGQGHGIAARLGAGFDPVVNGGAGQSAAGTGAGVRCLRQLGQLGRQFTGLGHAHQGVDGLGQAGAGQNQGVDMGQDGGAGLHGVALVGLHPRRVDLRHGGAGGLGHQGLAHFATVF